MEQYLSGKKLYGDDFTIENIKEWYNDEKEGYYLLDDNKKKDNTYFYNYVNIIHGFSKLPKNKVFKKVLGIGSAYGLEFLPISDKIENLFIIEPSDNLISENIGHITPNYIKPEINGKINFKDHEFDLVVCFSALHHIPNVSYILSEIYRCLKNDGYFISKEPIRSMGDWNHPRNGLTKRERGIPISIYREINKKLGFNIISEKFCFTLTPFLERLFKNVLKKPIFSYKSYIVIDSFLSLILKWNTVYHPKGLKKIGPGSVFYVLQK